MTTTTTTPRTTTTSTTPQTPRTTPISIDMLRVGWALRDLRTCLRYRHVTPWPKGNGSAKERARARHLVARVRLLRLLT